MCGSLLGSHPSNSGEIDKVSFLFKYDTWLCRLYVWSSSFLLTLTQICLNLRKTHRAAYIICSYSRKKKMMCDGWTQTEERVIAALWQHCYLSGTAYILLQSHALWCMMCMLLCGRTNWAWCESVKFRPRPWRPRISHFVRLISN